MQNFATLGDNFHCSISRLLGCMGGLSETVLCLFPGTSLHKGEAATENAIVLWEETGEMALSCAWPWLLDH